MVRRHVEQDRDVRFHLGDSLQLKARELEHVDLRALAVEQRDVTAADSLALRLAAGGGVAIRLVGAVGETVVLTGTVVLDKDFGAGYSYPVLLEDASLTSD